MSPALIMTLLSLLARNSDKIEALVKLGAPLFKKAIDEFGRQDDAGATYDVRWLQRSLNALMGAGLDVDGTYGEATREAVKRFQAAYMGPGDADGWAGVKTTAAILAALQEEQGE